MARCRECGKPTGWLVQMCDACYARMKAQELSKPASRASALGADASGTEGGPSLSDGRVASSPGEAPRDAGSAEVCIGLGGLLALVGLYFLLVAPTVDGSVVNFQRLYLGQTAAICGAVLFAAGVRPRRS